MYKMTPAMGWNSWNTFTNAINEELIIQTADAMVEKGLKDLGYEYIVIDDCWSLKERDEEGRLVPDPEKFPHGMKYLADYIHSKGLKFGIYSCVGTLTCAKYPGSYEYEYIDAKTFAEWGVDYLKYDYCFKSIAVPGHMLYKRMSLALANCGRDILLSACNWGADDSRVWIKETGANSWRSTGDINDSWPSMKSIALSQLKTLEYNGQGCFNDMDMLIVGMNNHIVGEENKEYLHAGGCTDDEYFTHFAFWCFLGSPLIIGCDIRNMNEVAEKILKNKDLIRINQDKKSNQPFFVNRIMTKNKKRSVDSDTYYDNYPDGLVKLAKLLDDGRVAIGMFNFSDGKAVDTYFNCEDVGVCSTSKKRLKLTDVATSEVIYSTNEMVIARNLEAHQSAVYIAEVID